jgi:type IV pilus assembly protein PilW
MNQPVYTKRQSGFTLIELMVSMIIGLLMLAALIALMLNVGRNNDEMTKTNRMMENGRFALQLLQTDLSHAGYWGGHVPEFDDLSRTTSPTDIPTAVPDPCLAYADWGVAPNTIPTVTANLIGIAMQSYEIPAVVPSPTLSVCASRVTNPKASTDVLVVRHAESCVPGDGNCPVYNAGNLYLQVARNGTAAPSPAYVLSDDASLLNLKKRDGTTAELRKFISNLYYVRNYSVTAGDGIPTLMRSQFRLASGVLSHKSAESLIEGVEGFRVEFGVDNISDAGTNIVTGADSAGNLAPANLHSAAIKWAVTTPSNTSPTNRGDGSPDGVYIHCTTLIPCTAAQLMNVVVVKLYVLVRSDVVTPGYTDVKTYNLGGTTLGPFNDGFKRHLFTQTIRLVNVSSRRETP